MPIDWKDVDKADVTDGLGRTFNWASVKGKHIYLCGHGLHCFKDGYFLVPRNTIVNFYQTYNRQMLQTHIMNRGLEGFVSGAVAWVKDRTFVGGQSCPDMTLTEDSEKNISDTFQALNLRADRNQRYVFFVNQFTGVDTLWVPGLDKFNGSRKLRLSEILQHLSGNSIHWTCCQSLVGWNNYDVGLSVGSNARLESKLAGDFKPQKILSDRLQAETNAAAAEYDRKKSGFDAVVQKGLEARLAIRKEIQRGYNSQGSLTFAQHSEGAGVGGAIDGDKVQVLGNNSTAIVTSKVEMNFVRTGVRAYEVKAGGGFTPEHERKILSTKQTLEKNLLGWLRDITAAKEALLNQPQVNGLERHWAERELAIASSAAAQMLALARRQIAGLPQRG